MGQERVRTMEELAKVSGISRPTLSRFFNNPSSVRNSTRARIEQALERYDYTPNVYAINQNRQKTRNLGIVVPFLADPFFAEIARGLELLCVEAGFNPILLSSHGDPEREVRNLDSLRGIRPAGVLLAPLGRRSHRDALHAFCEDVHTVLFDCDIEGVGHAFLGSNNQQSVGALVEYLAQTGECPAFFEMRTPPNPNAYKRRAAYISTMETLGKEPLIIAVDGSGWSFEEIAYRGASNIFASRSLPSGTLLCSNDRLAIGVLSAAFDNGLRVGRGKGYALRVAGHDDHPFARFTCPALTTVAQDYAHIAGASLKQLLTIIEAETAQNEKQSTVFEGRLVIRKSA